MVRTGDAHPNCFLQVCTKQNLPKMKKVIIIFSVLISQAVQVTVSAQSIGINNETPDSSAILDVKSTDKGILIPRLTKFQRLTIQNPAEGLLVFDTVSDAFWYYQDGWKKISDTSKNVWLREGTSSPAEVGDTSMYFMGNVAIGKDSAKAALDIENVGETGLQIFQSFNNPENNNLSILRGAQIEVSGESNYREIGIDLKMKGKSPTEWAQFTQIVSDSLKVQQIGAFNDINGFYSLTDSTFRDNRGNFNQLSGYGNTYQAGTYNILSGNSNERQRGIINSLDVYGDGQQIGTYNIINNSGDGEQIGTYNKSGSSFTEGLHYGTKNELSGRNKLYGTYQEFNSSGDSIIYGLYNDLDVVFHGGKKYGIYNNLESTFNDSSQYAMYNFISGGSNGGIHYGLSNQLEASGSGDRYGVSNSISSSGSGDHFGISSDFSGNGVGFKYGSKTDISGSGTGTHIGVENKLSSSGTGNHYGVNNQIEGAGDGAQFGVRNFISNTGSGTKTGTENTFLNNSSATQYAVKNVVSSFGNGNYYGTHNIVNGAGSGLRVAGYFHASGTGVDNKYAAIFNAGHVVINESSGLYDFRVESNNNQNMLFIDGSADKIGIGTNVPKEELDIRGTTQIKMNSSSIIPNLKLVEDGANDGARIIFANDAETNNRWTLYGRADNTDSDSEFNLFHSNIGNIITVEGTGDVGFKGNPESDLHVFHGDNAGNDGVKIQNTLTNEAIRFYVSSSTGNLRIYNTTGVELAEIDGTTGAYSNPSDFRLKENFKELHFNWQDFMSLKPLTYEFKSDKKDRANIGMVAQEVQKIYPEMVSYNLESDSYKMDYSSFGVVAIKAIQELKNEKLQMQKMIDQLIESNTKLASQLNKQQTEINQELAEIKKVLGL